MTYSKDNLRQIFQQPYNQQEWQTMLQNYFHASELRAEPERINNTPDDEAGYYLGKLNTGPYSIGLFYYQIQHGNVARKRVGLRNLVKSFINPNWGEFDAALVVFDSSSAKIVNSKFVNSKSTWRLSFVCDIKGENTAAKRFTYVFGESDNYYNTPVGRFDALQRNGISFENIKDAFSVEALSKEFFDEYREHYADIVEYITGKRYVKEKGKWVEKTIHEPCNEIFDQFVAVYKDPEKTVRDYIKKLMGRLVFLQFLQKKEWMGVPADRQDWKGGDTRFLQNKFNEFADKDNFIDGFLEPLFNDLNTNRQSNNDLASPKVGSDIKIPFLNGGLFQLDEEDCSNIRLPQHLLGDVLDFFERYNFTIDENDPNDAQIGVDPEMLGRVFENLLEDNKDKGAFYTPKEIVQYMCQESLIAYLQTGIEEETEKESIRQFVLTHEAEHLGSMAEDISIKLLNVKICDPAIGSGAFPMGLLRQLYLCQCAIHPEFEEKNAADVKRHIIQNNIYGVDIEKGAVDIARLRFWLSLIVDEETPRFLPNLDFKIMQGNSLLEQYKGVDLSKMTTLSTEQGEGTQLTWFDNELDILRLDLRKKLDEYYNCSDHQRKEQLKQEIIDNVKQQLSEQSINVDFGDLDLSANDQFTLWHTWFYDVFSQGGFDIVIANPPYVARIEDEYKTILGKVYPNAKKKIFDLYNFFMVFSTLILSYESGVSTMIVPPTWLNNKNSSNLRKILASKGLYQVDYLDENVFENAIVYSSIYFTSNHIKDDILCNLTKLHNGDVIIEQKNLVPLSKVKNEGSFIPMEKNRGLIPKIIDNIDVVLLGRISKIVFGIQDRKSSQDPSYVHSSNLGSNCKKVLNGKHINRYIIQDSGLYIEYGEWLWNPRRKEVFECPEKILLRQVGKFPICAYDDKQYYTLNTIYNINIIDKAFKTKYVLAVLNSKVMQTIWKEIYPEQKDVFPRLKKEQLIEIPIPKVETIKQDEIIRKVDEVLAIKRTNPSADTSVLESEIDHLVYHLYGMTYDEVLIVDPETPITREEYENNVDL